MEWDNCATGQYMAKKSKNLYKDEIINFCDSIIIRNHFKESKLTTENVFAY